MAVFGLGALGLFSNSGIHSSWSLVILELIPIKTNLQQPSHLELRGLSTEKETLKLN